MKISVHSNTNRIFIRRNIRFQSHNNCIEILLSYFIRTLMNLLNNSEFIQSIEVWINMDFFKSTKIIERTI